MKMPEWLLNFLKGPEPIGTVHAPFCERHQMVKVKAPGHSPNDGPVCPGCVRELQERERLALFPHPGDFAAQYHRIRAQMAEQKRRQWIIASMGTDRTGPEQLPEWLRQQPFRDTGDHPAVQQFTMHFLPAIHLDEVERVTGPQERLEPPWKEQ